MSTKEQEPKIEESETGKICSSPPVAALIATLAAMMIDDDFMQCVLDKDWKSACVCILGTWFAFSLFWVVVIVSVHTILENPARKFFTKAGKWKTLIVVVTILIVFCFAFYVIHFCIFT